MAGLPKFRAAHLFPEPAADLRERPDGTLLLSSGYVASLSATRSTSREDLRPSGPGAGDIPRSVAAVLASQAVHRGQKTFLAQRDGTGDWRRISYGETRSIGHGAGTHLIAWGDRATA